MKRESAPLVCDLCGSLDHLEVLRKSGGIYLLCKSCGFVFSDPRWVDGSKANDDYFTANFEAYVERNLAQAKQRRYSQVVRQLETYRRGGQLLEIGANIGGFLSVAAKAGFRVSGVEPVKVCAEYGRRVLGLDIRPTVLEDAGFADNSFDLVYSNAVFEHIPAPSRVFAEVARILRPGGVVFIDTVNWDSGTRRRLMGEWKLLDPPVHVSLYTPATLRRFAAKAGLTPRRISTHGVRFRPNSAPKLRGFAKWREEVRKLPAGIWARLTNSGDSITLIAAKPTLS